MGRTIGVIMVFAIGTIGVHLHFEPIVWLCIILAGTSAILMSEEL